MAKRKLIHTEYGYNPLRVKIYLDNETKKYVCRLYENGKLIEACDYFTDDFADAIETAYIMAKG